MKTKIMIFAMMLYFSATQLYGQETYLPVLTEGKMWKLSYTYIYKNHWQDMPDAYMTIIVDGDSIVGDRTCKKLLVDYRSIVSVEHPKYTVAYEEDGKVYRLDEDGKEHLIMNMNLHYGDGVINEAQTVLKEDYVIVDGVRRKRLMVDSGVDHPNGEWLYYMVEGIGLSKDEFVYTGLIDREYYFHRLIACYDKGKCIFSAADFTKESTNVIQSIPAASTSDNSIYDLQGRKRDNIKKGEIYIQCGRKYIK